MHEVSLVRDVAAGSGERDRDAPSFEVYANDLEKVPPEEVLTLICVPLA